MPSKNPNNHSTRFQKGKPGGPGAPKGTINPIKKLNKELKAHNEDLQKFIMDLKYIANDPDTPLDKRITVMQYLIDRGIPPNKDHPINIPLKKVESYSDVLENQNRIVDAISKEEVPVTEGSKLLDGIKAMIPTIDAIALEVSEKELNEMEKRLSER